MLQTLREARVDRNGLRYRELAWTLLFFSVYIGSCGYLATIANSDYWMVRAFDADESGVLEDLIHLFRNRTFEPPNYIYGTLHEYIALLCLYVIEPFHKPDIGDAVYILRFENAIGGGGVIVFVILLSRELSSFRAGIYSVIFLLSNSAFLFHGYNAKPELLQLFLVTASLYSGVKGIRSGSRCWFLSMGMTAGLAFATKFVGAFLLPMGAVAALLSVNCKECSLLGKTKGVSARVLVALIGFILAIGIFSPYMIRDADIILERLSIQAQVNKSGFLFFAGDQRLQWFPVLFGPNFLGYGVLLTIFIGLVGAIKRSFHSRFKIKDASSELFLTAWVLFYGGYVFLNVNVVAERYMLPTLPVLTLFAGVTIDRISVSKEIGAALKGLIIGGVLILTLPNLSKARDVISEQLSREDSPRITAGIWMQENLPLGVRIASDLYTYVPPRFVRHYHSSYLSTQDILSYKPDCIVSSSEISSRFQDESLSERFAEGAAAYAAHHAFYKGLREGTLRGYRLIKDFGEVQIYARHD